MVLCVVPAAGLQAQRVRELTPALAHPEGEAVSGAASATGATASLQRLLGKPWTWPLASLLVPGSGQLAAGQERGIVYLAAEAWLAARAISVGARGRRERDGYRELAFRVARQQFAANRVDGPFQYYESMERYVESGRYDLDPGAGFLPESDTTTFNGSVWLLARRTFLADPDDPPDPGTPQYAVALAFYQAHAVTPEFRWSWRDARLEQDVFRESIRASDEAFRSATNYLGALVINHLVSAVDALLVSRRAAGAAGALPRLVHDARGMAAMWIIAF
jgi:hypothetical protein